MDTSAIPENPGKSSTKANVNSRGPLAVSFDRPTVGCPQSVNDILGGGIWCSWRDYAYRCASIYKHPQSRSFITDVEQATFGGWAAGICRP